MFNLDDKNQYYVPKYSDEWRFVEFHLKSSVTFDIEIKKIITIYNQHMHVNFEKKSRNKLTTYAWINWNSLEESKNSFSKIRQRGFEIPVNGMDFYTGNIFGEEVSEETNFQDDSVYILCKIIIGRSFCKIYKTVKIDDVTYESIKSKGYDSCLFYNLDDQKLKQSQSAQSKSFNYKIFESTNVLPMYIVMFSNQANFTNASTKRLCEECETKDAEVYCLNDEVYLCKECDAQIHGEAVNDKTLKQIFDHKREPVDKIKSGKCYYDPENDVEFYCKTCNMPICAYCKVIGTHSKGDALKHELIDIVKVYRDNDPMQNEVYKKCEKKKKESQDILQKIKTLTDNLKTTQLAEANKHIDIEFNKEFEFIQNISFEFLREYVNTLRDLLVTKDFINWVDNYFQMRENFVKDTNKAEFIWIWNYHNRIISEILQNKNIIDINLKSPSEDDFKTSRLNEFNVVNYKFEETYRDRKDEVKNNEEKKRDHKKNANIELIKTLAKHYQIKGSINNSSHYNATNFDGSQQIEPDVASRKMN